MSTERHRPATRSSFKVAIICSLVIELESIRLQFDEEYEALDFGTSRGDLNSYMTGRLGNHNVVVAYMPGMGTFSASAVAAHLLSSFNKVRIGLIVGICGSVPITAGGTEIFLGDVVVSSSVIQLDFGRKQPDRLIQKDPKDTLGRSFFGIRALISRLSSTRGRQLLHDKIYSYIAHEGATHELPRAEYPRAEQGRLHPSTYRHKYRQGTAASEVCICEICQREERDPRGQAMASSCESLGCDTSLSTIHKQKRTTRVFLSGDDKASTADTPDAQGPWVHFGRMICSDQVIKSASYRDQLATEYDVIGFEMDSAGLWDYFPTIVIKGVCDYADGHGNKSWQRYAAATAAALTRAFLEEWTFADASMDQFDMEESVRYVDNDTTESPYSNKAPFIIPFPRDPDFVDCDAVLSMINKQFSAPASRVALKGLGGIGKSQLAIEYAYRVRDQSPTTSIFWTNASSVSSIEESFHQIASQAQIPGWDESGANILKLVHDWLLHKLSGDWLLILDNLDDVMLLETRVEQPPSGSFQNIMHFIPYSRHGSILITTRSGDVALKLVRGVSILKIEPMSQHNAMALLRKKLGAAWGIDTSEAAAARLVGVLDGIPLAIVQAAGFISHRAPRYSVEQFLEDFKQSYANEVRLLSYEVGSLRRSPGSYNSITRTWQISFDNLLKMQPLAACLLSLMSLFDPHEIPRTLLRDGSSRDTKNIAEQRPHSGSNNNKNTGSALQLCSEDEFEAAINTMQSHSFTLSILDGKSFQMHALVQLAMCEWLEKHEMLEHWKHQAISNVYTRFPAGEAKDQAICRTLFPHVKSLMRQPPKSAEDTHEWASLLYHAAAYAIERGSMTDAIAMSAASAEVRTETLGSENVDTWASMRLLGSAYSQTGEWHQAEDIQLRLLALTKTKLGQQHPSTLTDMKNLALTYLNQGRWAQAEELASQAVTVSSEVLGPEHSDTLTVMRILASIYRDQGKWVAAEELSVQVLKALTKAVPEDHPDLLASMTNLALTYSVQGRWQEAEQLDREVLLSTRRVLGEEHPETLISLHNLATLLSRQGRWEEAERLILQVVELSTRVLGVEHPSTLESLNSLALLAAYQGRWTEAELLEAQVMAVSERVLGQEHPRTLFTMHNLALVLKKSGKGKEAIQLQEKCLHLQQRMLGADHPDTQSSSEVLAKWEAEDLDVGKLTTQLEAATVDVTDTA